MFGALQEAIARRQRLLGGLGFRLGRDFGRDLRGNLGLGLFLGFFLDRLDDLFLGLVGGLITGIVGILMMPWKLVADPSGYIFTWLIAYSALLGPIGGILIADYFVCRHWHSLGLLCHHGGKAWTFACGTALGRTELADDGLASGNGCCLWRIW